MATQWYFVSQRKQHGPISTEEIQQMIASGKLLPGDLVWRPGLDQWTAAGQLPELFPSPTPAAPDQEKESAAAAEPQPPPLTEDLLPVIEYLPPKETPAPRWPAMFWKVWMILGAAVLFVVFFVPWWDIRFRADTSTSNQDLAKSQQILKHYRYWYREHLGWLNYEDFRYSLQEDKDASASIWGWGTGLGITSLIFSVLILPLMLLPLFVVSFRLWAWIGSFIVVLWGLIVFGVSLTWIFGAPSEDVLDVLRQGNSVGPYLALVGGLLLVGGGLGEGVPSLSYCLQKLGASPPKTALSS